MNFRVRISPDLCGILLNLNPRCALVHSGEGHQCLCLPAALVAPTSCYLRVSLETVCSMPACSHAHQAAMLSSLLLTRPLLMDSAAGHELGRSAPASLSSEACHRGSCSRGRARRD